MVPLLLVAQAGLLAWGGAQHSPAVDEVAHMAAGLSHWETGCFELYRVNPPLVRMTATLPVVLSQELTTPREWRGAAPGSRPEFALGRELIEVNGYHTFRYFTIARWACMPFILLGGYVCHRWARDLYGAGAGLVALALWCFCPNVLANGQMITPDAAAAALGVTAAYLWWRWLNAPGWERAFTAGVALGLAELVKTTWVILFALWPLLAWVWRCTDGPRRAPPGRWATITQGTLLLLTALTVLNLGYGFEGSFARLDSFRFVSGALGGPALAEGRGDLERNRFAGTALGALPVPVPRNYLSGIDVQKWDFERPKLSYLRGEWREGGWWYYYLYALAVKLPLGTWLLLMLAGYCRLRYSDGRRWRDDLVLLAPAAALLALVSSQTGFSHHLRYVLPALPFAYIWASQVAPAIRRGGWALGGLACTAVAWSLASSLCVYPHCKSYFNELAGGPPGGHEHLVDSNIDWGQDLFFLKAWLDQHPEAHPLGLAYVGGFDPQAVGIKYSLPPRWRTSGDVQRAKEDLTQRPRPGWYAVSVSLLHGLRAALPNGRGGMVFLDDGDYTYFQHFRPIATPGYGIYIYHLSSADCDRVRQLPRTKAWRSCPEIRAGIPPDCNHSDGVYR